MKTLNLTYDSAIAMDAASSQSVLFHLRTGQWLKTLKVWRERSRQRRMLSMLDADQLDDIGLSPEDVQREVSKPFWA